MSNLIEEYRERLREQTRVNDRERRLFLCAVFSLAGAIGIVMGILMGLSGVAWLK